MVSYEHNASPKVRSCFNEVLAKYKSLHSHHLRLEQGPIKSATMLAQPVINFRSIFSGVSSYRVKVAEFVRDSEVIRVNELPQEVLIGWFAHELGHVVDYEDYSVPQMIGYGIRYLISEDFKRAVEHKADEIAIRHGFRDEILITKRFILHHELLAEDYKEKIRKYYMPIEAVEAWQHPQVPGTPDIM